MGMRVDENGSWRSFRHRNYRILFPANAVSNIGSWAQRIAQDWLVLELTDNNGYYLGLVTAIQFAPFLLFTLHGGLLADRVNKRLALVVTNTFGGLSALVLGILVLSGDIQLWHVFACAAVLGISGAIDAPIRQSFTSEIVGQSDLANAVSLNSANFNAGRLVGPAISGFLIAHYGTGPSFIINACSYVAVNIALLSMRESEFFIRDAKKTLGTIREGLAYVRARPDLYVVMIAVFFAATFGLNFQIFNALMARGEFNKGAASFGLLGTFIAVGSLSGALISARFEKQRNTMFVIKTGTLFSLSILILSVMPTFELYAAWLPLCGFFALTMLITANSLMQMHSDPAIRGRITGIYLLIFMGGTPFGSMAIGYLVEAIGVRESVAICGGISLIGMCAIWIYYKDKVGVPSDITVEGVLPPQYDDPR
jgi:MFS family permease